MNYPKDNTQNNIKGARLNNYSKCSNYKNDSSKYTYSYNNKHQYYKKGHHLGESQRKPIDSEYNSYYNFNKSFHNQERSYSKDRIPSDETLIKERKNNTDNIMSNSSKDSRISNRSQEDQRNIIISNNVNYSNVLNQKQHNLDMLINNKTFLHTQSFDSNSYFNKPVSFQKSTYSHHNNINKSDLFNKFHHNKSVHSHQSERRINHHNTQYVNHDEDFEMKNNNILYENERNNSQFSNIDISNENYSYLPELNLSYLKIESSVLTSLLCKKSQELMKISRKVLKQNVTDFSIDEDLKAFSSSFSNISSSLYECFKFSSFPNFSTSKVISQDHSIKGRNIKTIKKEKDFLSKKLASERQNLKKLRESIFENNYTSRVLKVKQDTLQNKLNDIFSEN